MNKMLTILPPHKAKEKLMLSQEEEKLLALMADVIVEQSIIEVYEKRNSLPAFQQHRAEQRQH
jgi:hypothetical protein